MRQRRLQPGIPAGSYGILLRDASFAIRGGGSSARRSPPAVWIRARSRTCTSRWPGPDPGPAAGGLYADGVAIHPYGVPPDASWRPDPGEELNCDWGTLGGKVDEHQDATMASSIPSAPGGCVALDGAHAIGMRNNVVLESEPDGWHGEDLRLSG